MYPAKPHSYVGRTPSSAPDPLVRPGFQIISTADQGVGLRAKGTAPPLYDRGLVPVCRKDGSNVKSVPSQSR